MNAINTDNKTTGAGAMTPSGAPTTSKSILGKDDFLKIFLAQLAHQDPTAPVDSTQFVAQLAQFSSLELQQNANSDLEAIMVGQAAAQQTSVTNLVGRDVVFKTNTVTLDAGGGGAPIDAELAGGAGAVTAVISDASGRAVRTIKLGPSAAGPLSIAWDGHDDAGATLPAGTYTVALSAVDTGGKPLAASQRITGHVSGVSYEDGSPLLTVGTQHVKLSDVVEIKERNTP
jgi:flagellar basal-body rod modification protein FlgD